jgi:hypothetical protein
VCVCGDMWSCSIIIYLLHLPDLARPDEALLLLSLTLAILLDVNLRSIQFDDNESPLITLERAPAEALHTVAPSIR